MRLILLLCAAVLPVQAQSSAPAGLEPAWDIAVILDEIGSNASRLLPALEKLDAPSWVKQGASETYAAQWQSCRDQVKFVSDGAHALAKNPERLAQSLELFFRIEAVDRMLESLGEGARHYRSEDAARAVEKVYAEGGVNRERFRRYIVNLASEREKQFDVMDKEAQRCRATLMAPVPPKPAATGSRTTGRKK